MYINPLQNNRATAKAQGSDAASSGTGSATGIQTMFMQLLLTQLQNQDPLSPMDPSTLVNQLVGVNTLDQVSQINQLLQSNSANTSSGAPVPLSNSSAGGQ